MSQDIKDELEALRAEVAALSAAKEAQQKAAEQERAEAEAASGEQAPGGEEGGELLSRFQELVEAFGEDLKDSKPSTLLVVFALGVLVGRLVSK